MHVLRTNSNFNHAIYLYTTRGRQSITYADYSPSSLAYTNHWHLYLTTCWGANCFSDTWHVAVKLSYRTSACPKLQWFKRVSLPEMMVRSPHGHSLASCTITLYVQYIGDIIWNKKLTCVMLTHLLLICNITDYLNNITIMIISCHSLTGELLPATAWCSTADMMNSGIHFVLITAPLWW